MAKVGRHGLDEPQLEGGGAGAGIRGTKYSSLPSFKGNASTLGDIKKLTADSSHLKGGAKKAVDEAKGRAAKRTAVRAVGAAATGVGAKSNYQTMMDENASEKDSGNKDDGVVEATFRKSKDSEDSGEMATHYKPDNYKSGGKVSASRRADGIAQRGKTRGKVC
jgi:hypothetical protein